MGGRPPGKPVGRPAARKKGVSDTTPKIKKDKELTCSMCGILKKQKNFINLGIHCIKQRNYLIANHVLKKCAMTRIEILMLNKLKICLKP